MKKILVVFSAFVLLLGLSGAAGAYSIDYNYVAVGNQFTSPHALLPGFVTEDFDNPLKWSWLGDGAIVTGTNTQHAAPMGVDGINRDNTEYVSVPLELSAIPPNIYTATLSGVYNYIGLWWGSVDDYNELRFYKGGILQETITGVQAINPSVANGNQTAPSTNLYVNISGLQSFDSFQMYSRIYAFEADNITVGVVPEPTTLLLLGFGLLGLAGIRRKL